MRKEEKTGTHVREVLSCALEIEWNLLPRRNRSMNADRRGLCIVLVDA